MASARKHADGKTRCPWPGEDPVYVAYHDTEWGVPEYDDRALFEKLILDGFQAGLSWITILRKRDNFRKAFDDFEPAKIARYDDQKIHALMNDAGIVGATGFVGTALCLNLLDQGHHIMALSRHPEKWPLQHKNLKVIKVT